MKFLTNLSLGKKLTMLTALGLIIGISVLGSLGIRAVNKSTDVMLQERMTVANLVAGYLDDEIDLALSELKNTSRQFNIGHDLARWEAQVDTLEATYRKHSISIHSIYLVGEDGVVSWQRPANPALKTIDLSWYPAGETFPDSDSAVISGVTASPLDGEPVVFLAVPVIMANPGILAVSIDPARSSIGGSIQPLRLGQTGYAEIVDQNGLVVARTEPGPKLAPFERSDHSGRFAALISAGKPTLGLCHTCHTPVQKVQTRDVLAFVPLSQAHWGVVIRQSEDEALAPVRELRWSLLIFGLVLAAITIFVVFFFIRDIVRRLSVLTVASSQIAGGDLSEPISISRKDEIGTLATSFEEMRSKLKKSYGELENRTRELTSLLNVSEILSHLPALSNLDAALSSALDRTLKIMNEKSGSILTLDTGGKMLCCRVQRGLYARNEPPVCYQLGKGVSGMAAKNRKTVIVTRRSGDDDGSFPPFPAAREVRALASFPLLSKREVLGVLEIGSRDADRFTPENVRFLEGIARVIGAAVENAHLHQQVQDKEVTRGELIQDMFSIQEEERKRIARELHDETSQVLASLSASLEAAVVMLPQRTDRVEAVLRRAQGLSINILDEIHKLIYELRPSLLDDMGLVAATRWLADNNLQELGIKVKFETVGREKRLPARIETLLFRVIQEAVHNIAKHAHASNARINLRFKEKGISVTVADNGVGFELEEALQTKARPRGLGLLGMKERVELVKGKLSIRSSPESGTRVHIEIPLKEETNE
ncbi:MAG: ATP-binding protein [Chloroflexota bacterium]